MAVQPFRLTIDGHDGAGNTWANVMHYTFDDTSYNTPFNAAQDLVASWITACQVAFLRTLGSDCNLYNVSAQEVSPGGGFTATTNVNGSGSAASLGIVNGLSCDVLLHVGSAPWRGGHIYLGCCPDGSIVGSIWTAPYLADVQAFAVIAFNPITLTGGGGHAQPVVYKRHRVHPTPVAASWKAIVGHQTQPKPTLLGRRLLPQL